MPFPAKQPTLTEIPPPHSKLYHLDHPPQNRRFPRRVRQERRTKALRPTPRGLRTEFDEMLADMQRQFTEMMGRISAAAQQVPLLGGAGTLLDIREHEDEVVVVADLPGVEREMISVRLIDPRTLRIRQTRRSTETEQAGYYMRERRLGTIPDRHPPHRRHRRRGTGHLQERGPRGAAGRRSLRPAERDRRPASHNSGSCRLLKSRNNGDGTIPGRHERSRSTEKPGRVRQLPERRCRRKEELYEEAKRKFHNAATEDP